MELGGTRDKMPRRALNSVAKALQIGEPQTTSDDRAGVLVEEHFLLVMDERMRYLQMLYIVLSLTSKRIHHYVPKILAALKMALDSNRRSSIFLVRTLQVWPSSLKRLGAQRVLTHLCSILAILIPFAVKCDAILSSTLVEMIEEASVYVF